MQTSNKCNKYDKMQHVQGIYLLKPKGTQLKHQENQ